MKPVSCNAFQHALDISRCHYNGKHHTPEGIPVNWLNRILSTAPQAQDAPSPSTGFFDIDGQPVPLSLAQQDIRAARELIRAAAVRTTAAHGIPSNWLSYEVVTISDDEKAYFQLQVSLRIWDEQLWTLSSAYEQKVLKRIREEDVNVARAVRAVLWRVLPDAGCPYDELAGAAAWKPDAIRARNEIYDRLRGEIAFPDHTLPSVASGLDATATLPILQRAASSFGDTHPADNTGFHATRPVSDAGDAPAPSAKAAS